MDSISLVFPIPRKHCNPNSRSHWAAKAKHNSKTRHDAKLVTLSAISAIEDEIDAPWSAAKMRIKWFHPTNRHRDKDNIIASLKSTIDGIVDGGLLHDDNEVSLLPVERFTDRGNPRVEITVYKDLDNTKQPSRSA